VFGSRGARPGAVAGPSGIAWPRRRRRKRGQHQPEDLREVDAVGEGARAVAAAVRPADRQLQRVDLLVAVGELLELVGVLGLAGLSACDTPKTSSQMCDLR